MNGIEKGRKWNKRGKGRERRKRRKKKNPSIFSPSSKFNNEI
jgi:hypothetical protein